MWRDARAAAEKYRGELAQAAEAERARDAQSAAEASHRLRAMPSPKPGAGPVSSRANAARQLAERCRGLAHDGAAGLRVQGGTGSCSARWRTSCPRALDARPR